MLHYVIMNTEGEKYNRAVEKKSTGGSHIKAEVAGKGLMRKNFSKELKEVRE